MRQFSGAKLLRQEIADRGCQPRARGWLIRWLTISALFVTFVLTEELYIEGENRQYTRYRPAQRNVYI